MSTEHAAAHFGPDASSAAGARRFLADTLRGWACSDVEEPALLLVSELVGNAVLHARTEIDVAVRRDGDHIRVEVADRSPLLPQRKNYSITSATGRGLGLVERLAVRWGAEPSASGKTVWFELDGSSSEWDVPVAFDLDDLDDLDHLEDLDDAGGGDPAAGDASSHRGLEARRARPDRGVDLRRALAVP